MYKKAMLLVLVSGSLIQAMDWCGEITPEDKELLRRMATLVERGSDVAGQRYIEEAERYEQAQRDLLRMQQEAALALKEEDKNVALIAASANGTKN